MPLERLPLNRFQAIGHGLSRPEDVAVTRDGKVFASGDRYGVAELLPDLSWRNIGPPSGGAANGITIDVQGRILIANYGLHTGDPGPLERLDLVTGIRETLLSEVDGQQLISSNYLIVDRAGNIWCSHSTQANSFAQAAMEKRTDGFIFVLRPDGSSSIVGDGLAFANGLALSADEKYIYCAQTLGSNVMRFPVLAGGKLGRGEQYGPQLGAIFDSNAQADARRNFGCPDGIAFDVEGNLWVTLIHANKLVAITPTHEIVTITEDPDEILYGKPTNITWGGVDMKDLYVGMLGKPYILKARSLVAGLRMPHQL